MFHREFWFLNTFYLFDLTLTYGQPVILPTDVRKNSSGLSIGITELCIVTRAEPFHSLSAPPVAFGDNVSSWLQYPEFQLEFLSGLLAFPGWMRKNWTSAVQTDWICFLPLQMVGLQQAAAFVHEREGVVVHHTHNSPKLQVILPAAFSREKGSSYVFTDGKVFQVL